MTPLELVTALKKLSGGHAVGDGRTFYKQSLDYMGASMTVETKNE